MKKIILSAVAVMAISFANAQDLKSKKGENFMPESGDWAISFNANNLFSYAGNLFSSAGTNSIGTVANNGWMGTFVGKKFTSDKTADRYLVDVAISSNTSNGSTALGGNDEKSTTVFKVAAGLGKEWRRGKTRLQGVYGYDLVAGLGKASIKHVYTDAAGNSTGDLVESKGLTFDVGARAFLGAEYFIFPKISMGAQYTYNVMIGFVGDTKNTSTPAGGASTDATTKGSTSINIGNVGVASMNVTLHF